MVVSPRDVNRATAHAIASSANGAQVRVQIRQGKLWMQWIWRCLCEGFLPVEFSRRLMTSELQNPTGEKCVSPRDFLEHPQRSYKIKTIHILFKIYVYLNPLKPTSQCHFDSILPIKCCHSHSKTSLCQYMKLLVSELSRPSSPTACVTWLQQLQHRCQLSVASRSNKGIKKFVGL